MENHFIESNKIKLHYISYKAPIEAPKLVMIHGITANAHAFDGLVHAGLLGKANIYSPDLRGRGLSTKPAFSYTLKDHALDILGLLDHLEIDQAILAGHSYGGLLSAYICANYPDRIKKIVFLDAAAELHPNTGAMLTPVFERLTKIFDSYEAYMEYMKHAPQITLWDDFMESYYCADIQLRSDGKVDTIPNLQNMSAVAFGIANQNWSSVFKKVRVPNILINGVGVYNLGDAILPTYKAEQTVALMPDSKLYTVDGNHQTMLYGKSAEIVSKHILDFIL